MLCSLVMINAQLTGQAAAHPVTLQDDCWGCITDDLNDMEGIETSYNIRIEDSKAVLLPRENETAWEKKGVAVENRDSYDFLYAKNPSVLKEGSLYRMWYAGYDGFYTRILYATSLDGVNWIKRDEPLMEPGDPGDVDERGPDCPEVIYDEGTYRMWYLGNDTVNEWAMYATSPDGLTWTKHGVVFEETGVRPNTVLKDGGVFKMWYQYREELGHWKIYYAESTNGIEWIKHGRVLDVGEAGEPDDQHVGGAAVLKAPDGSYMMWYCGHDESTGYRVFYATSPDGKKWTKHGMVLDVDPGGQDQNGAGYPYVLKDEGNFFRMWYSGNRDGYDTRVMYAVKPPVFERDGEMVSRVISLPRDHRWDTLVIDKTENLLRNHIRVSILDGRTWEVIGEFKDLEVTSIDLSTIDNLTHPTIRLKAVFTADGTSTAELDWWKVTWVNTESLAPAAPTGLAGSDRWLGGPFMAGAALGIALFAVMFAASGEVGKYRLIPFISPLYTRLKKKEVLDLKTRESIFEYISNHPGDHYNSIKRHLDLKNGALAYHLKTLEREDFIESVRDSNRKRFYPVNVKLAAKPATQPLSVKGRILELVMEHPGQTQKEMSRLLDTSQQVVSYHVNQLISLGLLRVSKHGNALRYFHNRNVSGP